MVIHTWALSNNSNINLKISSSPSPRPSSSQSIKAKKLFNSGSTGASRPPPPPSSSNHGDEKHASTFFCSTMRLSNAHAISTSLNYTSLQDYDPLPMPPAYQLICHLDFAGQTRKNVNGLLSPNSIGNSHLVSPILKPSWVLLPVSRVLPLSSRRVVAPLIFQLEPGQFLFIVW